MLPPPSQTWVDPDTDVTSGAETGHEPLAKTMSFYKRSWTSGKAYADSKREHQDDYSAYLHQWVDTFHRQHRAADVFARIANGCKEQSRGRATYDRLEYEDCRDEIWWPTFLHHSRIVVMNRHSHEHCKSCTKTERGKVGCRFCASGSS